MDKSRLSRVVYVLAGVKLATHLATAGHYPLHADELYYVVCGRHLAWSFPDHPPLVPWLAFLTEQMVGASPFWLRLGPAVIGAILVAAAGWLAWRFGGGRLAQTLAAAGILLSPLYLLTNGMLQTVSLDQLSWVAMAVALVLAQEGRSRGAAVWPGVLLGLGILAKLTVLVWGAGLFLGLLLTRDRILLRSPNVWMGGVVAAVSLALVLGWQAGHGWPLLEFMAASRADESITPWGFLGMQLAMSGPLIGSVLLVLGFIFFWQNPAGKRWRSLGWAIGFSWVIFLATGGKPYYAGPTFPLLFAGGAVLVESHLGRRPRFLTPLVIVLLASQVWMVPAFLPVLSPQQWASHLDQLPHDDFRKMFGWEDLVLQVEEMFEDLSATERASLRILTDNYGAAGSIDVYGRSRGLPAAISGHNGYAFWEDSPALDPLLVVGYDPELFRQYYSNVRVYPPVRATGGVAGPEEGEPLFFCSGLKGSAEDLWRDLRHFD